MNNISLTLSNQFFKISKISQQAPNTDIVTSKRLRNKLTNTKKIGTN